MVVENIVVVHFKFIYQFFSPLLNKLCSIHNAVCSKCGNKPNVFLWNAGFNKLCNNRLCNGLTGSRAQMCIRDSLYGAGAGDSGREAGLE